MLRRTLSSLLVSAFIVVLCASTGGCGKKTDIKVDQSEEINTQETVGEPRMVVQ